MIENLRQKKIKKYRRFCRKQNGFGDSAEKMERKRQFCGITANLPTRPARDRIRGRLQIPLPPG